MVKQSNQSQWLPEKGWGAIQGLKAQNRDNMTTMEVWDELDWGGRGAQVCIELRRLIQYTAEALRGEFKNHKLA